MTSIENFKLTLTNAGVKKLSREFGLNPQKLREAAVRQGFEVEAHDSYDDIELPTEDGYYVPSFVKPGEETMWRLFKLAGGTWSEVGNETDYHRFQGSSKTDFQNFVSTVQSWLPLKRLSVED